MQTVPSTGWLISWGLYCVVIAALFTLVKVVNYKLHTLFDTTERIEAPLASDDDWTRYASSLVYIYFTN